MVGVSRKSDTPRLGFLNTRRRKQNVISTSCNGHRNHVSVAGRVPFLAGNGGWADLLMPRLYTSLAAKPVARKAPRSSERARPRLAADGSRLAPVPFRTFGVKRAPLVAELRASGVRRA